jgi:hypothetical protein
VSGNNLGFDRELYLDPWPADRAKADVMARLAERYVRELDAQFRMLTLFVPHPGEVGRTHEAFLRSVVRRLVPSRWAVGTGFVQSSDASSQQDLIIYDHIDHRALLEIDDCVVVDDGSLAGTIEVKTDISSKDAFSTTIRGLRSGHGFSGLYAWEGLATKESAVEAFWEGIRQRMAAHGRTHLGLPDYVYVRSRYVLLRLDDHESYGNLSGMAWLPLTTDPSAGVATDGHALVGLVAALWCVGIAPHFGRARHQNLPGWLRHWRDRLKAAAEPLPVPPDLTPK